MALVSTFGGTAGSCCRAACRFAELTGGLAAIGSLADAPAILAGERGTRITASPLETGSSATQQVAT